MNRGLQWFSGLMPSVKYPLLGGMVIMLAIVGAVGIKNLTDNDDSGTALSVDVSPSPTPVEMTIDEYAGVLDNSFDNFITAFNAHGKQAIDGSQDPYPGWDDDVAEFLDVMTTEYDRMGAVVPPPLFERLHQHLVSGYGLYIESFKLVKEAGETGNSTKLEDAYNLSSRATEDMEIVAEELGRITGD